MAPLARSELAVVGGGIARSFGAAFASIFLPDRVKYLPFDLANAGLAGTAGGG